LIAKLLPSRRLGEPKTPQYLMFHTGFWLHLQKASMRRANFNAVLSTSSCSPVASSGIIRRLT
jgi:hypothetical protein